MSQLSKRHFDQFSHSCRAHEGDQQTYTQTDRPRYSVSCNRPHLCYACDAS